MSSAKAKIAGTMTAISEGAQRIRVDNTYPGRHEYNVGSYTVDNVGKHIANGRAEQRQDYNHANRDEDADERDGHDDQEYFGPGRHPGAASRRRRDIGHHIVGSIHCYLSFDLATGMILYVGRQGASDLLYARPLLIQQPPNDAEHSHEQRQRQNRRDDDGHQRSNQRHDILQRADDDIRGDRRHAAGRRG
jgi:hypothetical protein